MSPPKDVQPSSSSDAAILVQQARAQHRESRKDISDNSTIEPEHESVQPIGWHGAEAGDIDETELVRKQRAIAEKLERRQQQLAKDGAEIERVRNELAALEAPLKEEIMSIRTALETSNKAEKMLVDEVNVLRDELHNKEKALAATRQEKENLADKLISVMANYEKRKTDALNGIARLVGEEPVDNDLESPGHNAPRFSGF